MSQVPRKLEDQINAAVGKKTFLKQNNAQDAEVASFLKKQEHIYSKRKER